MNLEQNDPLHAAVQADFNRLAAYPQPAWDHNSHYHAYLLGILPVHGETALEIGCGTGVFTRQLARRFNQVLAIDFSPNMLQLAQAASLDYAKITFRLAEASTLDLADNTFDCIASIATLHHLPIPHILANWKLALKSGGVIAILDLYQEQGWADFLRSLFVAFPVDLLLKLIKTGHLRQSPEVRKAWKAHGLHDHYLTLHQIRQECASVLPGARFRQHLLWRYSLLWRKP